MSGAPDTPVDVAIVGSGPAGLSALFQAGFHGLSAALFESHFRLGGQLAILYPEVELHHIPVEGRLVARNFMAGLEAQALQFGASPFLGERVVDFADGPEGDLLVRTGAREIRARCAILATGAGALLPEGTGGEGSAIRHGFDAPGAHAGRRVVVFGPVAADRAALESLAAEAGSLVVVNRRGVLPGFDDEAVRRLRARAEILHHCRLVRVGERPGGKVELLLHRGHHHDVGEITLEADALVLPSARVADQRLRVSWGLAVEGAGVVVDGSLVTSRPRILAVGDCASYPGKAFTLAATSAEAARAVATVCRLLGRKGAA